MRGYSAAMLACMAERRARIKRIPSIGFVGNIANNLYNRAVPLRKRGYAVDVFLHPHDRYVMSQPGWEEFDGTLPEGVSDLDALGAAGVTLPHVADVYQQSTTADWASLLSGDLPRFVRLRDFLRWKPYFCYLPTLEALQEEEVLLSVQTPYLAYLAGRPYVASQSGGDVWYECSRDDAFGRLQRTAYALARVFIVSNPWSYAHARRYGFRHLVYLPMIIDEDVYSPGEPAAREEWKRAIGGDFFVLMTSRIDDRVKGSEIGLMGFAKFAASAPGARLVVMSWGADEVKLRPRLAQIGVEDKVLVLPIAGKRRLVQYLRAADCLIDQFVLGYFGASGLEAMACGLPVIMRLERAQYDAVCRTGAPPVLDADSDDQVAAHLECLADSANMRKQTGERLRRWFLDNHGSGRWSEAYLDVLTVVAYSRHIGFDRSPLREPLSQEERDYHADQLRRAPRFPVYQ
jgi:glycosyltransferase involved in cell wall biosynthesis